MHSWKISNINFRKKIMLTYMIIVFIPLTIIFLAITIRTQDDMLDNHVNYMEQLNEQVNNSINLLFTDIERVALIHISDNQMISALTREFAQFPDEYATDFDAMNVAIKHTVRLNRFVFSAVFGTKNGTLFGDTDNYYIYNGNSKQINWTLKLNQYDKRRFITPVYKGRYGPLVTIAKMIVHPISLEGIGFAWVNLDFKVIEDMFEKSYEQKGTNDFLIIDTGRVIYNSNSKFNPDKNEIQQITDTLTANQFNRNNKFFYVKVNGKQHLFVGSKSNVAGWTIVQYIPTSYIRKSSFTYLRFYLVSSIILIFIAAATGSFFSYQMWKPVKKLLTGMKLVETGRLDTVVEGGHRGDDMGVLIRSFNQMTGRLKGSIENEYIAQMNERKVELEMLQAQINPHFLYNTLNLICSLAELEDINKTVNIAHCLSDMFRYNTKGKRIIQLREEIEQIKNYVYIQELRFPGKFTVVYDISPELSDLFILKFLFQPLVENAIHHGLEQMDEPGRILISARCEDNVLILSVRDNGVGMEESILDAINENLGEKPSVLMETGGKIGLGIINVHRRLQMYYGEPFGLSVFSRYDQGTTIILQLPIQMEEDVKNENTDC